MDTKKFSLQNAVADIGPSSDDELQRRMDLISSSCDLEIWLEMIREYDISKPAEEAKVEDELQIKLFPLPGFTIRDIWKALPKSDSYEDDYTRLKDSGKCSLVSDKPSKYVFVYGPADIIRGKVIPAVAGMSVIVGPPEDDEDEDDDYED